MQDTAAEVGTSDALLWTPSRGRAKAGWTARTCIQQLCEDTGCSTEDLLEAMNDRERWREKVRDIRADGTIRWWEGVKKQFNFLYKNFLGMYLLMDYTTYGSLENSLPCVSSCFTNYSPSSDWQRLEIKEHNVVLKQRFSKCSKNE